MFTHRRYASTSARVCLIRRGPGWSRRYSDEDISLLIRIQALTNEGLNLAGVSRVLQLEAEVERLRAELEQTRQAARCRRRCAPPASP